MSLPVLLVLVRGPTLLIVIALVARAHRHERVDTRNEWRWVRVMWAGALLTGAIAAWLLNSTLDLGRGVMLTPAVLGLFVVAGVGLAETVVRPHRPTGPRTASLASRRVGHYVPRALATAVAVIAGLHLATLALTTVTASADDVGRAGRSIAATCDTMGSAAGPYPGSFYSVPLALLLLVTALIATASLIAVVRRPRGFAHDEAGEEVLRRQSISRVLAAGGAALAASQAGIAFFAATALLRMDCQRDWMAPIGWLLAASVPAALLLITWFLGRLVAPGAVRSSAPAMVKQ